MYQYLPTINVREKVVILNYIQILRTTVAHIVVDLVKMVNHMDPCVNVNLLIKIDIHKYVDFDYQNDIATVMG